MRYSFENTSFLIEKDVKLVVVACNTSTAVALDQLRDKLKVAIIGVIEPGVKRALSASKKKKIGVIGTEATIQSGAYTKALKMEDPDIEVYSRACPLFVPLAEEGWTDNPVVEMTVESSEEDRRFAKPKSRTLTRASLVTKTLEGLMSR